jgi:hypothetical protein
MTFAFSPYLLAPITQDHQMLKSPLSLDPLTSWVTCVLLCTSCLPHVGLTDHILKQPTLTRVLEVK